MKSRLTVTGHIYHSLPSKSPTGPEPTRFFRWLNDDEQPVNRSVKVGQEWVAIDPLWLKTWSYLEIANTTPAVPGKVPTPEEAEKLAGRDLEWGLLIEGTVHTVGYVLMGESSRLHPKDLRIYRVRSMKGTAEMTYFIVPG